MHSLNASLASASASLACTDRRRSSETCGQFSRKNFSRRRPASSTSLASAINSGGIDAWGNQPACSISSHHAHSQTNEPTDVKRSEEHTSELQSLMRISYAVFCLKKKKYRR